MLKLVLTRQQYKKRNRKVMIINDGLFRKWFWFRVILCWQKFKRDTSEIKLWQEAKNQRRKILRIGTMTQTIGNGAFSISTKMTKDYFRPKETNILVGQ